jgi:hypothetical protein
MRVQWYRVKKTYEKPHGGFLAIGPRYPGVLSDDGVVVLSRTRATPNGLRLLTSTISRKRPKCRTGGVGGNEPNAVLLTGHHPRTASALGELRSCPSRAARSRSKGPPNHGAGLAGLQSGKNARCPAWCLVMFTGVPPDAFTT